VGRQEHCWWVEYARQLAMSGLSGALQTWFTWTTFLLTARTVRARDHTGAGMFTRSTPGCGTLAGPSLELEGFRSQKPKGSADSPGLIRPGALRRPARPGSVQLRRYDKYIPGIYQSYETYQ
jgi:hypothetical protein